jgi:nucleoside-diphosphate-sugar epimerase
MIKKVKIVLTGGEGLIGGAFRNFLNEKSEGVQLVDTDRKKHNKRYPLESIINLNSSANSVNQKLKGGTFIHAAGIANVSLCDKQPKLAEEANIDLTLSCLQKALNLGCEKFVFLSTGFIYGDQTTTPHEESAPTSITNVYLDTKFRAEKLVEDFASKNNIKGIILRLGNVYSKGSSFETVIGRILSQLNGGSKRIELFSTKPVRDFIYIKDLCEAIYQVIKSSPKKNCQIFNLSYGEGVSIANIIDVLEEIEGPLNVKQTRSDMKDSTLILNTNKFKTTFQWNPRINIITGLSEIQSK